MTEFADLLASVRGLTNEIRNLDMVTMPRQLGDLETVVTQLGRAATGLQTQTLVMAGQIATLQAGGEAQAARVSALEAVPPPVVQVVSNGMTLSPYVLTGTTATTPLYSLTLPAGSLAPGDELRVLAAGLMHGNRVKHMGVRMNGHEAFRATFSNSPRYPWNLEATVLIRDAATAVLVTRLLSHRRRWDHTTAVVPIDLTADVGIEVEHPLVVELGHRTAFMVILPDEWIDCRGGVGRMSRSSLIIILSVD